MAFCQKCGARDSQTEKIQVFSDGTKHIRLECNSCGNFMGYKKTTDHFNFDLNTYLKSEEDCRLVSKEIFSRLKNELGKTVVRVTIKVRNNEV